MLYLLAVLLLSTAAAPAQRVPDDALLGKVLERYVREDGKVDYAGLKASGADLREYVNQLGQVSPHSHPRLFVSREASLAYWINAYNALVLQSFVADYPAKRNRLLSVPGKAVFFYRMKHKVGGKYRTLADIENNTIRKFGDARIHFAIVCASASCPYLSRIPYTPDNVNERLEAETRRYFAEPRNFSMDRAKRVLTVPILFEWFRQDFGSNQSEILSFVARYRPVEANEITRGSWQLRYFAYDWSPNDVRSSR